MNDSLALLVLIIILAAVAAVACGVYYFVVWLGNKLLGIETQEEDEF